MHAAAFDAPSLPLPLPLPPPLGSPRQRNSSSVNVPAACNSKDTTPRRVPAETLRWGGVWRACCRCRRSGSHRRWDPRGSAAATIAYSDNAAVRLSSADNCEEGEVAICLLEVEDGGGGGRDKGYAH